MSLPSINQTLPSRVQSSERFPRIKEAEERLKKEIKKKKNARNRVKRKEMKGEYFASDDDGTSADEQASMFTAHVLNKDPELAKFMPFNEIVYPKLFKEQNSDTDQSEVMERLWVAGFVDRANRDKDTYHMYRAANKRENVPSFAKTDVSISTGSKSQSSLTTGAASIASTIKFDASKDPLREIPQLPRKESRANMRNVPSIASEDSSSVFSADDEYRLKVLEDSLNEYEKSKKKKKKKKLVGGIAAYAASNKSIEKSLKPAKKYPDTFSSFEVENVFERERIEMAAVRKIERAYIHSKVIHKLRRVFLCMSMAVRIQKFIRGVITRRRVAQWFKVKNELIVQYQCRVRKWRSNRIIRPIIAYEQVCATKIQKIVLGKLARVKCREIKRNFAAKIIQTTWRGVCGRVRADRMWLHKTTVPIQTIARKMVAKMRFNSLKEELYEAATSIQRCYRSWSAMRRLASTLHARENIYREYTQAMLTAEEEWAEDTLLKLKHRLDKKQLREKLEIVMRDYHRYLEDIHFKENDYIEINRQKDILSARAIQQGWLKELDGNIVQLRKDMTQMKLNCVFKKMHFLDSLENQFETKIQEMEEVARYREMTSDCRDMEVEDNRIRDFYMNTTARRRKQRMDIADERRKWMVHYYTPNGKPDKLRRPGRQWDPAAYAGPEKMTYCGASGVDLTAGNKEKMLGLRGGSNESVEQTLNEVSLQNYLQQVHHYEELLNPIYDIMKQHTGAPPGQAHPKDAGWGPVGHELPLAMECIGAIPRHWRGDREALERQQMEEEMQRQIELEQLRKQEELEEERRLLLEESTNGMSEFDDFFAADGEESVAKSAGSSMSSNSGRKRRQGRKMRNRSTDSVSEVSFDAQVNSAALVPKEFTEYRESTSSPAELSTVMSHRKRESEAAALARAEKRKARNRERARGPASIPWTLLDQLDGEKKKFEAEKSYYEFYHPL